VEGVVKEQARKSGKKLARLAGVVPGVAVMVWPVVRGAAGLFVAGVRQLKPFVVWLLGPRSVPGLVGRAVAAVLVGWAVSIALGVFPQVVRWPVVVGFFVAVGAAHKPRPKGRGAWYSGASFTRALIRAGVLKAAEEGQIQPMAAARSVVKNEFGTTAIMALPSPVVCGDVVKKLDRVSNELGLPGGSVEVAPVPGEPLGIVEVWAAARRGSRIVKAALPAVTDVYGPIRLGCSRRGVPDEIRLARPGAAYSMIIGGQTDGGKSSLCRLLITHYLLDPRAEVFIFGGKGITDYLAAEHACQALISGQSRTAYADTMAIIARLLEVTRAHNDARTRLEGTPRLLVLDEIQRLRNALSKAERDAFDKNLEELSKECRAAEISLIMATQELRVDSIPGAIRAMAHYTMNTPIRKSEEILVHGETPPDGPRPSQPGEILFHRTGQPYRTIRVDWLTDDAWERVCARVPAISRTDEPTPAPSGEPRRQPGSAPGSEPLARPGHRIPAQREPVDQITDPLLRFTVQALTSAGGELSSTELLELLPAAIRPASSARLGMELGKLGIKPERTADRRYYSLPAVMAAVTELS
jgi:hypothetical protein